MSKQYLVFPGLVRSESEGDFHYISASQLINLYRVRSMDCKIVTSENDVKGIDWLKYTILRPRTDGNYNLSEY